MDSVLARLAASFSPVGHEIDMKHIKTVRCAALDNRHLEVEATLCDDLECNSLLVPVIFPNECLWESASDSLTFEDCVLTNVNSLNREGERRLQQEHTFANPEAESVYTTLESASNLLRDAPSVFPDWWIPPKTKDHVSECELLRELLNDDDMLDARMDLFQQNQKAQRSNSIVKSVKVQVIGLMGLILKVEVASAERSGADIIANEIIPIRFLDGAGSIREKTLQLLSADPGSAADDFTSDTSTGLKEIEVQIEGRMDYNASKTSASLRSIVVRMNGLIIQDSASWTGKWRVYFHVINNRITCFVFEFTITF
jgi:hypothetical protein